MLDFVYMNEFVSFWAISSWFKIFLQIVRRGEKAQLFLPSSSTQDCKEAINCAEKLQAKTDRFLRSHLQLFQIFEQLVLRMEYYVFKFLFLKFQIK